MPQNAALNISFSEKGLSGSFKVTKGQNFFSLNSLRKYEFHAQSVFFWAHELMNSCAYVKNQFLSLLNRAYQSIKTRLRSDIDVINAQIEI